MRADHAIVKLQEYPPDEPVFVLRGGDTLAESVILFWVREAIRAGVPTDKIHGAVGVAKECRDWPHKKVPD